MCVKIDDLKSKESYFKIIFEDPISISTDPVKKSKSITIALNKTKSIE